MIFLTYQIPQTLPIALV